MVLVSVTPIHEIPQVHGGYWYLGTPYSKYPEGLDCAFIDAAKLAAKFLDLGVAVFSPIVHSHPIAVYGGLDKLDYGIWIPANKPLMEGAHGLIVGMLPGWENSEGLKREIEYFFSEKCEICYVEP